MAKHRFSRREFMGLSGTALAGLAGAQLPMGRALAAITPQEPDLVVFNARVFTVDPMLPRAEAFAVKAGRIAAVGSTDEIKGLIGKQSQTYDAKQMTIVPGFTDAHNHAPGAILLYDVLVGTPMTSSSSLSRASSTSSRRGRARRRRASGLRASSLTTPR